MTCELWQEAMFLENRIRDISLFQKEAAQGTSERARRLRIYDKAHSRMMRRARALGMLRNG